jgi:hypothetical protein
MSAAAVEAADGCRKKESKTVCCIGFNVIRIQLYILMRIRIRVQEAKPMRIHADPDPSQNLK